LSFFEDGEELDNFTSNTTRKKRYKKANTSNITPSYGAPTFERRIPTDEELLFSLCELLNDTNNTTHSNFESVFSQMERKFQLCSLELRKEFIKEALRLLRSTMSTMTMTSKDEESTTNYDE
jgi:hypothetical protein